MRIEVTAWHYLFALVSCLLLTGCKHTLQASSRSPVFSADTAAQASSTLQSMVGLGGDGAAGHSSRSTLKFCETQPGESGCTGPSPSISTRDLGFIPATLSIDSVELSAIQATSQGWTAQARIKPVVNGVSPWCRSGRISLEVDSNGRSSTSLSGTWCNWLLIGNITLDMSFSAEEIDPTAGSFSGFYEVHVRGTSNAASSGYLMAKIE